MKVLYAAGLSILSFTFGFALGASMFGMGIL